MREQLSSPLLVKVPLIIPILKHSKSLTVLGMNHLNHRREAALGDMNTPPRPIRLHIVRKIGILAVLPRNPSAPLPPLPPLAIKRPLPTAAIVLLQAQKRTAVVVVARPAAVLLGRAVAVLEEGVGGALVGLLGLLLEPEDARVDAEAVAVVKAAAVRGEVVAAEVGLAGVAVVAGFEEADVDCQRGGEEGG